MKRLTLNIPEDLHTRLKVACALQHLDMTEAVLELIREYLGKVEKKQPKK